MWRSICPCFVGHSFYSQGSRDQTVSASAFLLRALAALGEQPEPTAADADLGRLFAECAVKAPTILALDGLEPLYRAVGHGCQAGRYTQAKREVYQDRIQ